MKLSLKMLTKYAVACLILIFLANCKSEKNLEFKSENFEIIKLAEGVYSCIHKIGGKAICNVGVVDNGQETIVFDSFLSPEVAEELKDFLKRMELSPVKYVVNSHFHNDHIRGNQVFAEKARIISSQIAKDLIEKEEPLQIAYEKENAPARLAYYDSLYQAFDGDKKSREYQQIMMWRPYYEILAESHLKVKTTPPDILIDSLLNLDGPDRKVQLISKGQGHTDSDLILYLPDDRIVFSGDLVFNGCHPYVAHGDIINWKAWLDFINSLKIKTVMPGHGSLGDIEIINQMKNYLQDLEIAAGKIDEKELTDQTFSEAQIPEPYIDWWFDRFYPVNLNFAYESLKANN